MRGPSWECVPVVVSDDREVPVVSGPFNLVVVRPLRVGVSRDVQFASVVARRYRQSGDGALPRSCVCARAGIITAIVAASAAISTMAVSSIVCFSLAVGIYRFLRPLRLGTVEYFSFGMGRMFALSQSGALGDRILCIRDAITNKVNFTLPIGDGKYIVPYVGFLTRIPRLPSSRSLCCTSSRVSPRRARSVTKISSKGGRGPVASPSIHIEDVAVMHAASDLSKARF